MRIIAVVLALVFLGFMALRNVEDFSAFTPLKQPIQLSSLQVTTPQGGSVTFEMWSGKWVLMNVWATWCPPCVVELPTFFELAKNNPYPDKLAVIAVSFDANKTHKAVLEFLKDNDVGTFAGYKDPGHIIENTLDVKSLPMTYLINPQGYVVAEYRGGANWADPKVIEALDVYVNAQSASNKSATSP